MNFDIWMKQNITCKNTPAWVPGTPAHSVDTRKNLLSMLMKEIFPLMNHVAVATGSVAAIIWHLRNISRHTRPTNEMSLPHGSSRNHPKQFPYLICLLRCWQQTHTETETIYSGLCLKSSEMLRQTGYLISIMSRRLATGETIMDYLPPFHRLTKKANYAN